MKLLCEIMGFYDADVAGGATVHLIVTKYVCATLGHVVRIDPSRKDWPPESLAQRCTLLIGVKIG